jgi:nitrite reductase/ring-hydroxylating ferredoxin subunit
MVCFNVVYLAKRSHLRSINVYACDELSASRIKGTLSEWNSSLNQNQHQLRERGQYMSVVPVGHYQSSTPIIFRPRVLILKDTPHGSKPG